MKQRGTLFPKQLQVFAVAFFLQVFGWNEPEGGRVDAIAEVRRRRTVVEHVAQVRIGAPTAHLDPDDAEVRILQLCYPAPAIS